MRKGSALIVAAVILVAGFAAADALRGRATQSETAPTTTAPGQTTPTRLPGPQPEPEAPRGWPDGSLPGTLVFSDDAGCRVRVLDLGSGRERPVASFAGNCQLWTPRVGQVIAYGLGPTSGDGFSPFRIADLGHPNRELGGYRALFGVVLWSPDGQRVAWCGRRRTGFDLEVGGAARRLPTCPTAYTPGGEIAYAIGNRLAVGGRTVVRADGGVTYAHWGSDGSLAIVVDGRRVVRYDRSGTFDGQFGTIEGRTPIFSPDNCAAVYRPLEAPGEIRFLEFGCFHGLVPMGFFGRDAAWSPDGRWLAVAERQTIAFHRVVGPAQTVRWPAAAARLAWRSR